MVIQGDADLGHAGPEMESLNGLAKVSSSSERV